MTRNYDFSGLTKPLSQCHRAYAARRVDGAVEIWVVQDEALTPPDACVFRTDSKYEAREAAAEIGAMIDAARTLAGA